MVPQFITYYYNQYHSLLLRYWNQLTPIQYVSLLIFVALCGWVAMKGMQKR